ncbi:MAG: HAD-IIB family hydrolase [Ruminococcaceae bacterium]|nr:HAD-IIB family hydrolase [Oscillospiraceae bacterium]
MKLFEGCLLACDIDGTLQVNGEINQRSIEKIKFFVDEGGNFALSTGRTACAVNDVLEKLLDYICPSVVGNGTVIYDFKNDKLLSEVKIESEALSFVEEFYQRFPSVGIELHSRKTPYLLRTNSEIEAHGLYEHMKYVPITLDSIKKHPINKVLFAYEDFAVLEELMIYGKSNTDIVEFKHTTADLGGKKRHYIEMVPCGISKATALKSLCKMLEIKNGAYFAIGDYYNDLEMIRDSDIGCFTADAPDELKAQADYIAGLGADGAVADFIDYLTEKFRQ